jgi:hypothetical protein
MIVTSCKSCRFWRTPRKAWYEDNLSGLPISVEGGGGQGGRGLVTKSRRLFFDFTSHEKQNFIFTIFRSTEA